MSRFAAVEGVTLSGPTMTRLACGCIVDAEAGAVWSPCEDIEAAHARAVDLARLGMTSVGLAAWLDIIRNHVAANQPAASARQGALL